MSQLDRIEQKLDQLLAILHGPTATHLAKPTPPTAGDNWRHAHTNCATCDGHGNIHHPDGVTICHNVTPAGHAARRPQPTQGTNTAQHAASPAHAPESVGRG